MDEAAALLAEAAEAEALRRTAEARRDAAVLALLALGVSFRRIAEGMGTSHNLVTRIRDRAAR